MTMNKKERALLEKLEHELFLAKAFKMTEPVDRDVEPPKGYGNTLSLGWDFNAYSGRVYKACSSVISHGEGWEKPTTQQPRKLFSTEVKALRAMRFEMEKQFAEKLANVDKKIASAINSEDRP